MDIKSALKTTLSLPLFDFYKNSDIVLCIHGVCKSQSLICSDTMDIVLSDFYSFLDSLIDNGYSFHSYTSDLFRHSLGEKRVIVTVDDVFEGTEILLDTFHSKYHCKPLLFYSSKPHDYSYWPRPIMSLNQILPYLEDDSVIASHSLSHYRMSDLSSDKFYADIFDSMEISSLPNYISTAFAYPFAIPNQCLIFRMHIIY